MEKIDLNIKAISPETLKDQELAHIQNQFEEILGMTESEYTPDGIFPLEQIRSIALAEIEAEIGLCTESDQQHKGHLNEIFDLLLYKSDTAEKFVNNLRKLEKAPMDISRDPILNRIRDIVAG